MALSSTEYIIYQFSVQ